MKTLFITLFAATTMMTTQAIACNEGAYECVEDSYTQYNPQYAQPTWQFQGSSTWENFGSHAGGGGYIPDLLNISDDADQVNHFSNLIDTYGGRAPAGQAQIDSYRDTGSGDGFNIVTRGGVMATEKYFVQGGKSCQTNYDSSGNVTYTTEGCDE